MRVRTAAMLLVLATLCLAACGGSSGSAPAPERPTGCGGERPAKPDGGRYACVFSDDFNGSTLDLSKWMVTRTPQAGFATGRDCYVASARNVSVSGGALHLTSRVEPLPFLCHSPLGDFTTNQSAGSVLTYGKFAQTYGRFEFRAKFPPTAAAGVDSALWMYPQNPAYGPWPHSGEIDVAEWFGNNHTDHVFPSVHYAGEDTALSTGHNCVVNTPNGAFHTYAVEWTATSMQFYYDDKLCFQHSPAPAAPLAAPRPFDQPFDLVMTQTGVRGGPVGTSTTMSVDWVRAWK